MKPFFAAFALAFTVGCGNQFVPPVFVEPPPATPKPFGGRLRVVGNKFHNDAGEVHFKGLAVCCVEYPENGWPWISESFLEDAAKLGVNRVHIRMGPYTSRGESTRYAGYVEDSITGKSDISRINPSVLGSSRQIATHALSLGIYVEVDVWDVWREAQCSDADYYVNPFHPEMNIQGIDLCGCRHTRGEPNEYQKTWAEAIARSFGDLPNVMYQVGNESFRCLQNGDNTAWELGIISVLKSITPGVLVGTNSGNAVVERSADYITRHADLAQNPEAKPVIVNEFENNELTADFVIAQAREANRLGTYYDYWRGGHSRADYLKVLGASWQ